VFTYRPYQPPAIAWLASRPRGMVKAAAGSGKTIVAAGAIHRVLKAKPRTKPVNVGWMCNTIEQGQQAFKAMLQVFYGVDCEPAKAQAMWVQMAASGDGALLNLKVACAAAMEDWSDVDVLIVDECHHSASDSWLSQIETAGGARWGFTATPPENEEAYNAVVALFGNDVFEIQRSEVKGNLAPAKVVIVDATDQNLEVRMDKEISRQHFRRRKYWMGGVIPKKEQEVARLSRVGAGGDAVHKAASELYGMEMALKAQVMWQVVIDMGIFRNKRRNDAAVQIAKKHSTDSTIILVNKVEHATALSDRIPGSVVCHSKMGAKNRRKALDDFRCGLVKCLVATSLLDEGADLPIANVLIMVCGGRSNAKAEQRTGRVLRTHKEKTHGTIYDFEDNFHPLAKKHSLHRRELYAKLGYEFSGRAMDFGSLFGLSV